MRIFIASQLRHRPSRALSLGLAIVVTAVSFVLLAAAARTSGLKVTGSVKSNFRPAYDILVRPRDSKTPLEQARGLVRDNYLSGIFGGISIKQWHQIVALPGVAVAAPIANVGYVLFNGAIPFSIQRFLDRDPYQLYRLRYSWVADNGTSVYPAGADYVYYNRVHRFTSVPAGTSPGLPEEIVPGEGAEKVCEGFSDTRPLGSGPFYTRENLYCFSSRSPRVNRNNFGEVVPHGVGAFESGYYPILLSAIDPVQEGRLLHLDRAVVSGRYLSESDHIRVKSKNGGAGLRLVPVLASSRVYARETLRVTVERLSVPHPAQVPQLLTSGLCRLTVEPCPQGFQEPVPHGWPTGTTAYSFLSSQAGVAVGHEQFPISLGYRELLSRARTVRGSNATVASNYWTVSRTRYRTIAADTLEPLTTTNPPAVWRNPLFGVLTGGYWPAPPENRDLQFRKLTGYAGSNRFLPHNVYATPQFSIVGHYDPEKLPGFSPLSRVPLETYYPPLLEPTGAASEKALAGQPLSPTQNVGDYIQQPPLMLTTINALEAFSNSRYFFTRPPISARAPLSVIRVRVAGVSGPDSRSRARINSVALRIYARTGLDVDITAGSSPHPLSLSLPKGRFGRPALMLREGWVKKGVSVAFLHGVGRKQLALFTLIPLICCLFLGNSTYAAVRARRAEIGTLLTLGWSRIAIFLAILGEVVVVGIVSGVVGVALAATLATAFSLHAQQWVTLLVFPVSLAIALVAGVLPAWSASRLEPLSALRPPIADAKRAPRVRRITELALVNLRRVPTRAVAGGAGLLVGVAALTVLLAAQRAFDGVLAGTLLGDAITIEIRGFDYLAVVLVIALAALSIADVLYLNLRERQAELVTLRTLGWDNRHLVELVCVEGLALAIAATFVGALLGIALGAAVFAVPIVSLFAGAVGAAAGATVAAILASVLPVSQLERLTPPTVLAADE
jgi:putative ABC transport system permease protein